MRRLRAFLLASALVLTGCLAGSSTTVGTTGAAACTVDDTETAEILPGVTLTWDSSFRCENSPDSGSYEVTVRVANAATSSEGVTVEEVSLSHATPRLRGEAPEATATADGLPLAVAPGGNGAFMVEGTYDLVETDEGTKANLHLRAEGTGTDSGERFTLSTNVHLRG